MGEKRKIEFLEITMQTSIVTYVKAKKDSDCFRFDAEFFKKEYLEIDEYLRRVPYKELKDFGVKIYHPNEIKRDYVDEGGVLFLRAQNVRPLNIDLDSNKVFISAEDAKKLSRNVIKYTDVLITRSGANYGQCAIYLEKEICIASSHTFIVRTTNIKPFYLAVFLNTKYGRCLIDKGMYGAAQPEISPYYLYRIPTPIFSEQFSDNIENIYKKSFDFIVSSKSYYAQAEKVLLGELGLLNWKPKHQLTFVKYYSTTQNEGRIDSEYYQPMYDEIETILSKRNRESLYTLCSVINYGTVPTSPYVEKGVPYIKGLNLIDGLVQGNFDLLTNTNNVSRKYYTKENDIIISQMGTVGKAGLVTKDQVGWLFASFTIRIRLKNNDFIDPHVLTLYINSVARKWYLMRKIAQASVRQNTDLPTIRNLKVPEISSNIQNRISSKIIESYDQKGKSKRLQYVAKHGVELAIEKNEKEAQKWIDEELNKLNITL